MRGSICSVAAAAGICALLAVGKIGADDSAQELADIKAKVAALESQTAADGGAGDASALSGMRNPNTKVRFGGDVEIDVNAIRRSEKSVKDKSTHGGKGDVFNYTNFGSSNTNLYIKAEACKDASFNLKLDLDDFATSRDGDTNNYGQGNDLLEEAYYQMDNVMATPTSIYFGKKAVPFGLGIDLGITDPYTFGFHDSTVSYLAATWPNGGSDNTHSGVLWSPTDNVGPTSNVFLGGSSWKYKQLLTIETSVFQNCEPDYNANNRRGMYEDASEDSLLFQSSAARATLTPTDNLSFEVSFLNAHMESQNDNTSSPWGEDGVSDKQAISLGADWKLKSLPLRLYTEYIKGYNRGFCDKIDSDTAQIGGDWTFIKDKLDFIVDGETILFNNDMDGYGDEALYRASGAFKYTTDCGVYFMIEYLHEWYQNDINAVEDGYADVFSFRTGFNF